MPEFGLQASGIPVSLSRNRRCDLWGRGGWFWCPLGDGLRALGTEPVTDRLLSTHKPWPNVSKMETLCLEDATSAPLSSRLGVSSGLLGGVWVASPWPSPFHNLSCAFSQDYPRGFGYSWKLGSLLDQLESTCIVLIVKVLLAQSCLTLLQACVL